MVRIKEKLSVLILAILLFFFYATDIQKLRLSFQSIGS
jgi:hypothetical protein